MANVRQLEPQRFYYTDRFKVTAYNNGTKVSTIVSDLGETYSVVLDIVPTVNDYYMIGLEERVYLNADNSNAVTQYATVISTVKSPPIDTFVNLYDNVN